MSLNTQAKFNKLIVNHAKLMPFSHTGHKLTNLCTSPEGHEVVGTLLAHGSEVSWSWSRAEVG